MANLLIESFGIHHQDGNVRRKEVSDYTEGHAQILIDQAGGTFRVNFFLQSLPLLH